MPLQSIIVVFLRIAALQLVATFLLAMIPMIVTNIGFTNNSLTHGSGLANLWLEIIFVLVVSILATLLWVCAGRIARFVIAGHEATIPPGGLTRADLFAFAFVYLGLSFFIGGIGSAAMNLFIYFSNAVSEPGLTAAAVQQKLQGQSIQQIAKQAVQVLLGIICLLNANRFAKKLVARGQ